MASAASYPPLQKAQERGTRFIGAFQNFKSWGTRLVNVGWGEISYRNGAA